MKFEFIATIGGGAGPEVWDAVIAVSGENMTIRQALDEVERMIAEDDSNAIVLSIGQKD